MKILTMTLISFFCLQITTVLAESNNQSVAKLTDLLGGLNGFEADFTQTLFDEYGDKIEVSEGTVLAKRPGSFRWQTTQPDNQLIISDGKMLWHYDEDLEQVTIQELDADVMNTPALLLSGKMDSIIDSFSIIGQPVSNNKNWLFELTPHDSEAMFQHLQLYFIKEKLSVMEVRDGLGQTTKIIFQDVNMNKSISDKLFTFNPPDGVDIISDY